MTAYTFNQIIDYTRTSAATYVANTGFVTQTPASKNLLTYTQEVDNAAWVKTNVTALPFDPALISLGSEVVANGDFSSTASWTVPVAGASITGGALVFDGVTSMPAGDVVVQNPAPTIVVGRYYAVTYTINSGTTNPISVNVGGTSGTVRSAAGTYTEYLVATATTAPIVAIRGATGIRTGSIDNISVKEVIGGLITAPDGTLTADAVIENTATAIHQVRSSGATYTTGNAYTISVYAKNASGSRFLNIYPALSVSGNGFGSFNLIAGTAATTAGTGSASASITDVGNGWYRCSVSFVAQTTITLSTAAYFSLSDVISQSEDSYTGDGTSGIYLWGAQLELAAAATDYTRNVGGLYPPRFDYDPVTLAPRGLLIEEQRTNLLLRSEEFESASWGKTGSTVTANAITSPDGTADADKLVDDTANGAHVISQSAGTIGATETLSFYAKPGGRTWALAQLGSSGLAYFDIQNGVLGTVTGGTATITPAGNGWFRCTLVAARVTTAQNYIYCASANGTFSYTGDGTSGIYLWGAQLEAGAFATSYIPTVASQVTRTADVATVTGANFSRWYNQSEGTLLIEANVSANVDGATGNYYATLSDGTISNTIHITEINGMRSQIITGGVVNFDETVGSEPTGTVKAALAYATNNTVSSANGAIGSTDTSVSLPTVNRLNIGVRGDLSNSTTINGHIRRIRYYPTRLSNTQLQALTA